MNPTDDAGRIPDWLELTDDGRALIAKDIYGALQIIHASAALDGVQLHEHLSRILRERPALPLIGGLIEVSVGLARKVYGPEHLSVLLQLATLFAVADAMPAISEGDGR